MSFRYTKGPWSINFTKVNGGITRWHIAGPVHGSCYPICSHVIEGEPDFNEQMCNVALINASPELFEAAKAAMQCIGELPPTQFRVEVAQMLQAAIAKAMEGQ